MSIKDISVAMDDELFAALGDVATYQDGTDYVVIIEEGVERHNVYGERVVSEFEISIRKTEISGAAAGDEFRDELGRLLILDEVVEIDIDVETWRARSG